MTGTSTVSTYRACRQKGNGRRRVRTGVGARLAPYLFASAAVLYLVLLVGLPFVEGLRLGFTDTSLLQPTGGEYVGIANYRAIINDPGFWRALASTLQYTGGTVVGGVLAGLVTALAVQAPFRGRRVVRSMLVMPWAVPTIATALVFGWILNYTHGVLNAALQSVDLSPAGWLISPDWAMVSVVLVTTWQIFPLAMLVILAAIQSVPAELYEAARVDGASYRTVVRYVIIPAVLPTMRILTLLMTIWSFRRFEIIWLLTGGGPLSATNTLVIDVYREGFINNDLGKSAAIGTIGLVLAVICTLVYFAVDKRAGNGA